MLKMAIYGLLRVAFDLLNGQLWWWGVIALTLGLVTALFGVVFAAVQSDMKRLLAYSSIENIGIIVAGIGLVILFKAYGKPLLATITLTAVLYHTLNHAFFKSLLFLATGSVLHATKERSLGKLGGLIHRMPWVAWLALVGTLAISGIPPLNGFVSEWLLLQAFLFTPSLPQGFVNMLVPLAAAALVLTAALTGYVMVKFYGIVFLGRPRESNLAYARDAGRYERVALAYLAAGCVLLGVFPVNVIEFIDPINVMLIGSAAAPKMAGNWLFLAPINADRSSYSPLIVLVVIVGVVLLTIQIVHRFYHGRVRIAPAVGLRISAADAADAGHGGGLRPADPPGFRAVLPDAARAADAFRQRAALFGAGRRPLLVLALRADRPRRRMGRARRRPHPAGTHFGLSDLQLLHASGAAVLRPMNTAGFASQFLQLAIAVALAPLLVGWVNQCRAWLANKSAPSLFLPYRTIRKLFAKDAVVAENASAIFRTMPYIVFGAMCCAAAIVPSLATAMPFARAADAIALVGLFALARVFMALAAMDIGTAFGSLGARREMFVGFLAEPALLMVLFTASLISGSTSLTTIVDTLAHRELAIYPSLAFAGVAFTMVSLAENARIPVDNPATHLELTMIHEAMILEYSARHLALIEWAAALKLFNYSCIGLALFFPVGIAAAGDGWQAILGAAPMLIVKLAIGGALLALIETLSAKMRIFRAPEFLGTAFLLAVLGAPRQPDARKLADGRRPALRAAHQPARRDPAAARVRDAHPATRAFAREPLRRAGFRARALHGDRRLRHASAASVRVGGAHRCAQGRAVAMAAAPADPEARRQVGRRGADQRPRRRC